MTVHRCPEGPRVIPPPLLPLLPLRGDPVNEPTDADRERAQELWREIGKPEAAWATPEQLLAFLRQCPDAIGLRYAARLISNGHAAVRCFEADHDGLIDELRLTRSELVEARRTIDAVDKWLLGESA